MAPNSVLAPAFALAGLTFLVLALVPIVRFRAAFAGRVIADDFKLGESPRVPAGVSQVNRNYMNLLEVPLLFYVASLTAYLTDATDRPLVILAWTYVILRCLHSLVHITYNNVFHRLTVFAASNVVLLIIWLRLFQHLFSRR